MENTICVLRGERTWLSDKNMNYIHEAFNWFFFERKEEEISATSTTREDI